MNAFALACAIVDPARTLPPEADPYEQAMSALTLAAGLLERNPPKTKAQHNRLSDQTLRIARVEVRSEAALIAAPSLRVASGITAALDETQGIAA